MLEQVLPLVAFLAVAIFCCWLAGRTVFFIPVSLFAGFLLAQVLRIYSLSLDPLFVPTLAFVSYVAVVQFTAHTARFLRLDTQQKRAFWLSVCFVVFFVGLSAWLLVSVFGVPIPVAFFFVFLLCATSLPRVLLSARVRELLAHESCNTRLFALVVPLLFVPFFAGLPVTLAFGSMVDYVIGIVLSVGVGVFVGVLFSKILVAHKRTDSLFSILVLLFAGFLTYALADLLNGVGGIAAASLGLFLVHAPRHFEKERPLEGALHHLFLSFSLVGTGTFASSFENNLLILVGELLVVFYAARLVASMVCLRSVLSSRDLLSLVFLAPMAAEGIVLLLFFNTILLPASFTTEVVSLLGQASILTVFFTQLLPIAFCWRR